MTSILLAIIGVILVIIGGTLMQHGATHTSEHTQKYFQDPSENIKPEHSTKIPPFEKILNISSKKYSDSDAPIQINISKYLYYLNSKFNKKNLITIDDSYDQAIPMLLTTLKKNNKIKTKYC